VRHRHNEICTCNNGIRWIDSSFETPVFIDPK
jgi:hypothetical protein